MLPYSDRVKGHEFLLSKTKISRRLKRYKTFLTKRYIRVVMERFTEDEKYLLQVLPKDSINTYLNVWLDQYLTDDLNYKFFYKPALKKWRKLDLSSMNIYTFMDDWEEREKIFKDPGMKAALKKYSKLLNECLETSEQIETFFKQTTKTNIKENFPSLYAYLWKN